MAPSLVDSSRLSIEGIGRQIIPSPTKSIDWFKDAIQLDLCQSWSNWRETLASRSIKESTLLKAAWILTLRCFQPEEVISISYDEGNVPQPNPPIAYTVRVEPDWDVRSLLQTLEMNKGHEVTSFGAKPSPSRHVCTAALRYITKFHKLLTPLTSLNGNVEVSSTSLTCN